MWLQGEGQLCHSFMYVTVKIIVISITISKLLQKLAVVIFILTLAPK